MKVHHLRPAEGSVRERRRVGRGKAAGRGKTAGRGTKGYLSRHQPKAGFEGGQMPLQRRVPKLKGFTNRNRVEWAVVNVGQLGARFAPGTEVTPDVLRERGMVRPQLPIKLLGEGEIDRVLTIQVHRASASARAKVERAGGRLEIVSNL